MRATRAGSDLEDARRSWRCHRQTDKQRSPDHCFLFHNAYSRNGLMPDSGEKNVVWSETTTLPFALCVARCSESWPARRRGCPVCVWCEALSTFRSLLSGMFSPAWFGSHKQFVVILASFNSRTAGQARIHLDLAAFSVTCRRSKWIDQPLAIEERVRFYGNDEELFSVA